jgi:epoxyqueuosine reductase
MDISELIYDEGLAVGYSRIGALEFREIENESIEAIKQDHPWAKSMIIATFHYNFYKIPSQLEGKVSKRNLFEGRYVEGSHEYGTATEFEAFLSNEMIKHLDVTTLTSSIKNSVATRMGIGITRTNGYFYTEEGSYCHLHAWLVDVDVTCDFDQPPTDCPGHCGICVKTCPEKALTKVSKDTKKCISFQTELTIDNFTIGCDRCQDLCPYNKHRWEYQEEFIGLTYE